MKSILKDLFISLSVRNYRLFFIGQGLSLIGTWMQRTTMGWFVYRITNSAFLLGLMGFLSMIPSLFISPFAGAWSDRVNRRNVIIVNQMLFMLQAGLLAAGVLSGYINSQRWWPLIVLSLMQGMIEGVDAPLRQHIVLDLVSKRSLLPNAIATNSAMFNAARLVGPSVAGALVVLFGEGICFTINSISYIPVIISLFMIHIHYQHSPKPKMSTLGIVLEGWKYSWKSFPIRYLITNLSMVMLFAMAYASLIPVFARDILKGNAGTQGLMLSTAGVGALISSIYMASRKTIKDLPFVTALMLCVASIALIVFSQSHSIVLSMAMMFFIGLGLTTQMSATNTMIQSVVSSNMRGRVLSVYTLVFNSFFPFGSLLIGIMAKNLGASTALLVSAGICLVWSLYGLKAVPTLITSILRMLVTNKNTEIYRPQPVRMKYPGVEG